MADLTPVTVWVNKEIADDVQKKRVLEVILRGEKARYKANIKCAVASIGKESQETNEILNRALNKLAEKSSSIEEVNSIVRNFENNITKVDGNIISLSGQITDMSLNVDSIFKSTSAIKTLSFLNTGLSMANLAATGIGFAIISNHLSSIDSQIDMISQKLEAAKDNEMNKLTEKFHQITMRYNSLSDAIENDEIKLDDQQTFLIDTSSFICRLKDGVMHKSFEISELLEMIYSVIVPYTAILNSFVATYYLENQKLPNNYQSFTGIYDSLLNDDYLDIVERYWFLDRDQSNHDTFLTIDAMMLLTIQCKAQIMDQVELVETLKTKEKMDSLKEAMNEEMKQQAEKDAVEIAQSLHRNSEECKQVLLNAVS